MTASLQGRIGMPERGPMEGHGGRWGAQLTTDKLAPAILVMQYHIEELHDTRLADQFFLAPYWGIGCSSTLLIIFISPIMVVQKSTKQNKMKYLTNLTRKIEITTSIHYNISINSSINGEQTDQFFRYRPTFCECLKQYIV